MQKLDLVSFSFLTMETKTTPMHVGSVMIFVPPEGRDPEDFFQDSFDYYRDIFSNLEPFNHKLSRPFFGLGFPEWRRVPNFDAGNHINIIDIDPPGDQATLDRLISNLNQPLLSRDKPLWEMALIRGLEGGRFALYFKVSHACIDGIGGMRLMQSVLTRERERTIGDKNLAEQTSKPGDGPVTGVQPRESGRRVKPQVPKRPRPKGAGAGKPIRDSGRLNEGLKREWENWTEIYQSYRDGLGHSSSATTHGKLAGQNLLPQPFSAPTTAINGTLTPERTFAFRSISLHELKALRKKLKVTVNDLVLAVCAGALRRYLLEKNALPEQPLTTFVPVSVRSHKAGATGNDVSFMLVNLGTHIAEPNLRLELISASAKAGKEMISQMSRTAIKRHASLFSAFAIFGNMMGLTKLTPPFNVLISNVPASRDPLYLNGARLEHLHPVSFLYESQGLNITVISYEYTMDFGFIACDDVIPDIAHLADLHLEAFRELEKEAG